MKVEVKRAFYDATGLHKVGDIADVDFFDENLMKEVVEEKPKTAKASKKTETAKK